MDKLFSGDLILSLLFSGVYTFAAAIVATIVVVVWAIPVHLLLTCINLQRLIWYIVAAVIASFVFAYLFKPFGNTHVLRQALVFSAFGSLGAATFWYWAVYCPRMGKGSHINGNNINNTKLKR